jgi:cell division protein FtsA
VRKSQILDINQATHSIRSVLHEIEKKQDEIGSKITIGNAFLVISGQHIKATPAQGTALVEGAKVGSDEMHEVLRSSRSMPIPRDRELLDIVDQDYVLDNLGGITTPKGMSGRVLKLNSLQIHADRNRIQDARTAAEGAHLEIREPLFAATCAAEAVLEEHERRNGALVLDIGGGSTGYAVYCDGYLVSTGVIGVGGDHVTNDIAHAFQTTNSQAEGLKTSSASAILGNVTGESARIRVEQGENTLMDTRTISRRALDTVVNARLMELFTVIRETLEDQDLLHRLHAGVILTGGGSRTKDIGTLAQQVLGMNVRHGRPIHVDGLDKEEFPPALAAISGALLYAHRNYEEKSILDGLFGRFFK